MKIKTRNFFIIGGALASLALVVLIGQGETWRLWTSNAQRAEPTDSVEIPTSASEPTPDPAAFDRMMICNIATVPFVELFDLLRSAPAATRLRWIKQLDEMPAGPWKAGVLSGFYKTFVQLDPHAAAESITELHDKSTQRVAAVVMVGAASQSAMGEMAQMLAKLPSDFFGRGSPNYLSDVIYDWSALDPSAAARFLEENPEVAVHHAGSLLLNWARLSPDEAKAWLERQPEEVQTEDAFDSWIDGWFQGDEANALEFAVAHGGEEKFKRFVNGIATVLLLRSPDEARNFLLRLPKEARTAAIHEIGMSTTGEEFDASKSGQRPAEDVARWIITLPKESWREGLGTVLDHWESQNAAGFSAWLDQLPPDTRDEIVAAYCFSGLIKQLDRAIPLLLTVGDPTRRDQTLREYMADRLPLSRDRAMLVIKKSALSEAQKKQVIDLLPQK